MTWHWKFPSLWQRLVMALLIVAAASLFRVLFFSGLGRGIPYLLYFPTVALAALYGGLPAGMLATVLSAGLSYFWVQQGRLSSVEALALGIFAASGVLISFICEAMHRAHQQAKQAEAAQRETKEYLENLFNHANAPIIVWDPQFKITRFNHAFESLTGRAAAEVIGQSLELLFPPTSAAHSMGLITETTGGERWETVEIPILHRDGSIRTVLWNSATIFAADGTTPVATIAQGHEITARKQAQEALRESEDRFRRAIVDAPFPIMLHAENGAVLQVSNTWCEITGYAHGELATIADWTERAYGERKTFVQADIEALYGLHRRKYEGDYAVQTKSGSTRIWEFSSAPLGRLPDGRRLAISMAMDVTERRQAERALRETNDYLDNLFNHANAPIIVWDADGKITRFNHAFEEIAGVKAEQVAGQGLDFLFAADQRERAMGLVRRAGAGERFDLVEVPIRHASGFQRTVLWNSAPIYGAGKEKQIATIAQGQDITERKQAEETLKISRERLLLATEGANLGVWNWNTVTGELIWSDRCKAFFGLRPDEVMSYARFREALHPEDRERTDRVVQQALDQRTAYAIEYRSHWPDGSIHWLEAKGRGYYDAAGRALRMEGVVLDISERKRAEAALRDSEERFRLAAQTANDLVYEWDLQQDLQWFGKVDEMLGYEPGEFPRTLDGWVAAVHPEDQERVSAAIQAHLKDHAPYAEDYRVRQKDGAYRWWSARGAAARNPEGKPVRWVGSVTDITARKRGEEALNASEVRYRRLHESMMDSFCCVDMAGVLQDFNPAYQALVGYSADEIHRLTYRDLTPEKWHAEETRIVTEQVLPRGYSDVYEKEYRRKDGTTVPIELRTILLRDAENRPAGMWAIIRDISSRKQAEETLKVSEVRYRRLFETTKDGILILDAATGLVVDVNPFLIELLGFSHQQFLGKKIWELGFIKDLVANQANFAELQQKEYLRCEDLALEAADGRRIRVEFISNVYLVNQQKVIQCNIRDIAERMEAQEAIRRLNQSLEQRVRDRTAELEAVNRELEAFSYSVSHDLRTPLRAMDGFSMALLEDYAGQLDETAQSYLSRIRAGSQRMGGLIDDLLNLSKLTREKVQREHVDLTAMAEEIGADLRRIDPERGVKWSVAPALTADADKGMVRALLTNLLGNAWKFTGRRAGARIEFGATEHDGDPAFFVRDNGAGFDMAYAGRLFGAFQRLHSTQEFAGNGIGLALVQRIVRRHGGRVWAEGAVGLGATFYFTLGKERD